MATDGLKLAFQILMFLGIVVALVGVYFWVVGALVLRGGVPPFVLIAPATDEAATTWIDVGGWTLLAGLATVFVSRTVSQFIAGATNSDT